jgi:hypothetical protein
VVARVLREPSLAAGTQSRAAIERSEHHHRDKRRERAERCDPPIRQHYGTLRARFGALNSNARAYQFKAATRAVQCRSNALRLLAGAAFADQHRARNGFSGNTPLVSASQSIRSQ